MPTRNIHFTPGEYYHLYNRGVDKRNIFEDDHDRNRLAYLLHLANGDMRFELQNIFREFDARDIFTIDVGGPLIEICAWVFMDNHFHILAKEKVEGGISKFMRNFCGAYSRYFNTKQKRSGALFEGRFKAVHVDTDTYLKYLFSYIHLNPIKMIKGESDWKRVGIHDTHQAKDFLIRYTYSSLIDFLHPQARLYEKVLNRSSFPEYFPTPVEVWEEIISWFNFAVSRTPQK